ncbi:MAG: hypothetical protein JWM47_1020 [Acidimicrobiales bacterium]|nr:hypothetical protein [Acidimicrobiales bacterium]
MSTHVDTDPSSTTEAARSAAADTAAAARDQARAVASTAGSQVQDVAGEARTQAANVAGEAKVQAQKVVSTATSEVSSQLEQRLSDAAEAARTTANELRALAEGRPDEAGRTRDLARQASERLEQMADRVDELGVRGVTDEVTDFARRRPVAFLAGALAAGILAGRLGRAGKEVSSSGPEGANGSANGFDTSTGYGGVTRPVASLPTQPMTPPPTATMPGQSDPVLGGMPPTTVLPDPGPGAGGF